MKDKTTSVEINDLINRAKTHDLGVDFLMNGSLDAVAMTFSVHAFVVDGARDYLSAPTVVTQKREAVTA